MPLQCPATRAGGDGSMTGWVNQVMGDELPEGVMLLHNYVNGARKEMLSE